MSPLAPKPERHVHVVGVAGVGMSALAQALLDAGYEVTGSDRYADQGQSLEVLQQLRLAGVTLLPQDGSGVRQDSEAIAVSTAIEPDNPDLRRAIEWQVPVVHRAEMLARLTVHKRLLAVTGTAGKTTVTGLIGHICAEAGLDPVVVNGGAVNNWQQPGRIGSVRKGAGHLMIIEADESDRSLLRFHPQYAVITNVSKDHFELDEVKRLFQEFRRRTTDWTLLGPQAAAVLDHVTEKPPTILVRPDGRWIAHEGREYPVPMPGRHNAENVQLAVRVALKLGLSPEAVQLGLSTFRGIHRRLEVVAHARGITVFDDYAHNPAKIAASWQAVAESARRVLGIWRPHGYGPLALLFDELANALAEAARPDDRIFILPVYYAGGTAKKTNDAERLAEELARRGKKAFFAAGYEELYTRLLAEMRSEDAVLGMGARDPELPAFLRSLLK